MVDLMPSLSVASVDSAMMEYTETMAIQASNNLFISNHRSRQHMPTPDTFHPRGPVCCADPPPPPPFALSGAIQSRLRHLLFIVECNLEATNHRVQLYTQVTACRATTENVRLSPSGPYFNSQDRMLRFLWLRLMIKSATRLQQQLAHTTERKPTCLRAARR